MRNLFATSFHIPLEHFHFQTVMNSLPIFKAYPRRSLNSIGRFFGTFMATIGVPAARGEPPR